MARLSYPKAGEPLPEALPPAERTVGQLVAESMRYYGDNVRHALLLGIPPALLTLVMANVSGRTSFALLPTLGGAVLSASYVAACVLVLGKRPGLQRLVRAWLVGWAVFVPVPYLVVLFIVPAVAWLAAFGLAVPVLIVEDLPVRPAVGRAWRLARAGYVHALGSLATLAILVLLTQGVLSFLLRGAGNVTLWTASFLAAVVVSPLLLIGSAMLYTDQVARAEGG